MLAAVSGIMATTLVHSIPRGYVPVVTTLTPAYAMLNVNDALQFTMASTAGTVSASVNVVGTPPSKAVAIPITNTGGVLFSVGAAGNTSMYLTGITATTKGPMPAIATVWRKSTAWSLPTSAYAVASGVFTVDPGVPTSVYNLPDAVASLLDGKTSFTLRAGFVTSGAVNGFMDDAISASSRRGIGIAVGDGNGTMMAQHGYLLEAPCKKASDCSVLGVTLPASVLNTNSTMRLGWALYETVNHAPPPPYTTVTTAASILGLTADIEIAVCVVAFVFAVVCSVLVCRCAVRRASKRSEDAEEAPPAIADGEEPQGGLFLGLGGAQGHVRSRTYKLRI